MKYFDDFSSKFGFNDGDSMPPDAEAHWVQNMRIMNALLEQHGSDVRLICWYRNGMHNCYLLLRVSKETFDGLDDVYKRGRSCHGLECFNLGDFAEAEEDLGWHNAYEEAIGLDSDGVTFVDVTVETDNEGLDKFCDLLVSGKTGEDAWRELTGPMCRRCGSVLKKGGHCPDETCPYSDRMQYEEFTDE